MFRRLAISVAVFFALVPCIAAAQPATMPANTVYGRGATPSSGGPGQAIPTAKLFPNAGVPAGPVSCSSHNWFNTLSSGGVLGCAQPAIGDISGLGTGVAAALAIAPNSAGGFVTSPVPYANMQAGISDTVIGFWGSTVASALAINNCSVALTYNTSTHVFGCNSSVGSGTVTEQKNTASSGLTTSGNCDNTTTNASSPCNVAMNLDSAIVASNAGLATTIANGTMMGWSSAGGGACHLTPKYSGRVWAQISGTMNETGGGGLTAVAHWGTGTGPNNGAASTGTAIGNTANVNAGGSTSISAPFSIGGVINVGSTGTAVWIDGLATASGSVSFSGLSCSMHEIL
jgi:hypothetical protein